MFLNSKPYPLLPFWQASPESITRHSCSTPVHRHSRTVCIIIRDTSAHMPQVKCPIYCKTFVNIVNLWFLKQTSGKQVDMTRTHPRSFAFTFSLGALSHLSALLLQTSSALPQFVSGSAAVSSLAVETTLTSVLLRKAVQNSKLSPVWDLALVPKLLNQW